MNDENRTIRIGTRGSPLALAQTVLVREALEKAHPSLTTEVKVIKTSGDWLPEHGEKRLSEVDGGKGLFAKEIEKALLIEEIDIAVHSMKDMDSYLAEGLVIEHMLERENPRDVLLLNEKNNLANSSQIKNAPFSALKEGAVVGAASVRRTAFIKHVRPDLNIVPIRGNVQTRIDKLRGENAIAGMDATFLAMAGLNRLGLQDEADIVLEPEIMLPAAGQGAVGIQIREGDQIAREYLDAIAHEQTFLCVLAERAALKTLDGSCHTPIGAFAEFDGADMRLRLKVASLDGKDIFENEAVQPVSVRADAEQLGRTLAETLKDKIPQDILGHG